MADNRRLTRINDEVRRELAEIIRSELNDPRIAAVTTVIRADVTRDFKYCKVFVSVLGDGDQKAAVMEGIRSAGGYIRKLLASRVNLRVTPELHFIYDDVIEHGLKMSKIIDGLTGKKDG